MCLTILGILSYAQKRPDAERPYKAIGYPILPAIYIIMGIAFCILLLFINGSFHLWP
jgi:APA family basic amino acid/polyamine antiporter